MSTPALDWLPPWVETVTCACWICDPAGRLVYLNSEAEQMLGVGGAALGNWCHTIVQGRDEIGKTFCRDACPAWCDAMLDRPLPPRLLRTRRPDGRDHLSVVWIEPLTGPQETHPWLVHCAYSQEQASEIEPLLRRVINQQSSTSSDDSVLPSS